MKRLLFLLMASLLVLTACGDDEEQPKDEPEVESKDTQDEADDSTLEEESEEEDSASEDEAAQDDVPREHKNALKSAQNYLDLMAFSEKGLFEQLTSEHGDKYPEEAAQYAIDNVEVDYNEQALKSAQSYQELMPMSDQELYDQLTSEHGEKFTEEQAQYAIDHLD